MKKKQTTKTEILQPGQLNEYWENVLGIRATDDARWNLFSPVMRFAAEMYARNRDRTPAQEQQAAA